MFGSVLTLASFMKLIHATFLGQRVNPQALKHSSEVPWTMWFPCMILAILCIIFGIFANQIPLKYFILPAIGEITFIGIWNAGLATLLIIISLILGVLIFRAKGLKPAIRQDSLFIGGETLDLTENRVRGTEFYNTVQDFGVLKAIYQKAEAGCFDIYEQGKNLVFGIGKFFQYLHNGILPTYLVWGLLGMLGLFFLMNR
jgi:NADH:ubiquinone oxidoreductase subunit 5 (subunit L)/multisubunit Na+/H+ antiporter MnhA subunit